MDILRTFSNRSPTHRRILELPVLLGFRSTWNTRILERLEFFQCSQALTPLCSTLEGLVLLRTFSRSSRLPPIFLPPIAALTLDPDNGPSDRLSHVDNPALAIIRSEVGQSHIGPIVGNGLPITILSLYSSQYRSLGIPSIAHCGYSIPREDT